jgi:hypothetical protein
MLGNGFSPYLAGVWETLTLIDRADGVEPDLVDRVRDGVDLCIHSADALLHKEGIYHLYEPETVE